MRTLQHQDFGFVLKKQHNMNGFCAVGIETDLHRLDSRVMWVGSLKIFVRGEDEALAISFTPWRVLARPNLKKGQGTWRLFFFPMCNALHHLTASISTTNNFPQPLQSCFCSNRFLKSFSLRKLVLQLRVIKMS